MQEIEIRKGYYSNGNIWYEMPFLSNYKIHGIQKQWHKNGNISCIIHRYHDMYEKIYQNWHEDNSRELIMCYKHNTSHGLKTRFKY